MEIFEQQQTLTGSLLSKFIPMQTEKIGKYGNCFFRCISKMLSGTEAHHIKLRAEVCRYIVTNGKSIIQRYLRTFSKDVSPISYMKESAMTENGIWATDVEVMAISCMLNSDVYISTEQFNVNEFWKRNTWNRYSGCIDHTRDPQTVSLYISNLNHNHYEPVVRLMNSGYDSIKIHYSSDNP